MKFYEISYYRTHYWIEKRYAESELGVTDAIRKSRVKSPIEVTEITEEQYKMFTQKKKQMKQKKMMTLNRRQNMKNQYEAIWFTVDGNRHTLWPIYANSQEEVRNQVEDFIDYQGKKNFTDMKSIQINRT